MVTMRAATCSGPPSTSCSAVCEVLQAFGGEGNGVKVGDEDAEKGLCCQLKQNASHHQVAAVPKAPSVRLLRGLKVK